MTQPLSAFHLEPNLTDTEVGVWKKVEPIHCHKREKRNALIEAVRFRRPGSLDAEVRFRFEHQELPFFFDHPIDHLPGMLEVCAMRQLSLAVCHLLYDVPMHYVALLGWMKIKFHCYADLDTDTRAEVTVVNSKITKFRSLYTMSAVMHQGDTKLMRADGEVIMMHPLLAKRFSATKVSMSEREEPSRGVFEW